MKTSPGHHFPIIANQLSTLIKNAAIGGGTLIILTATVGVNSAKAFNIRWISEDISKLDVEVGEGGMFEWVNKDGTSIKLTGGKGGSRATFDDRKIKGGSIQVLPGEVQDLLNPNFGNKDDDISKNIEGKITEGVGQFTISLENFLEIDDIKTTFSATLVSEGSDNFLNASVYGQGDQLAFAPQGTIHYTTKWKSSDEIVLSDGGILEIGSFYLNSVGDPTSFNYSLSPDLFFNSSFTIGQTYIFVTEGDNLRFQLTGGSVTKDLKSVPEPATIFGSATALSFGALLKRGNSKKQNKS